MHDCDDSREWYVLRVKIGREKLAAQLLEGRGYTHYLPSWSRAGARHPSRDADRPLFPGYIFCQIDFSERTNPVVTTPCVLSIVRFGGQPAAVPAREIESLRCIVNSRSSYETCEMYQIGSRVVVTHGPLQGVRGKVCQIRGRDRLVFEVESVRKAVAIEIDPWSVERLDPGKENKTPLPASVQKDAQHWL